MNKSNIVAVTAGEKYTDIDALACAISYATLLNLRGIKAIAYLNNLNQSVTPTIKKWDLNYLPTKKANSNQSVVLVDISDPKYIAKFVKIKNVINVFDHHAGFSNYWKSKIGKSAKIQQIGACATLIVEEYIKYNLLHKIHSTEANLLYTAILSNTLNFKASVTTKRDIRAYNLLKKHTNLPNNWAKLYFTTITNNSIKNPTKAIQNDIKAINVKGINKTLYISQLELWEGSDFIKNNKQVIKSVVSKFANDNFWFFTLPCISKGKNYLYSENKQVQNLLTNLLKVSFKNNLATTNKLYLRKEIIKKIIEV